MKQIRFPQDPRLAYWKKTGEHFGFPACCVAAFLRGECVSSSFDGTGFRTCACCAEKDPSILLAQINMNRKHPLPFPDSRGFEVFKPALEAVA